MYLQVAHTQRAKLATVANHRMLMETFTIASQTLAALSQICQSPHQQQKRIAPSHCNTCTPDY
jgi:hypothetical protein